MTVSAYANNLSAEAYEEFKQAGLKTWWIEAAELAAMRQRVNARNLPPIEDDPYCDEYA